MKKKKTFKDRVVKFLVEIYDAMFSAFIFVLKKFKQLFNYLF